ncbi:hypothetical protein MMC12_006703 [Toensbergia leucococca]|nr:hypothetical protein [Toensbergia leucococca]
MMLVMGYSSPSSPIRLAFLPLFFVGAWEAVPSCSRVLYRIPWAGLVGGNIIVSLFQYVEVALLSAWDFESKAPKSVPKDGDSGLKSDTISGQGPKLTVLRRGSLCQRMKFGYDVMTSTRNIGTPYMVKNTPAFSTKDPGYIPSRLAFCCRKATIIILAIFVIYLASQGSHSLEQNAVLYSAQAVPILASDRANLSSEEVVTRFVTVVGYWFCTYLAIDTFSSVFNLIFVALGLEDVRVYRPNFGPISEAYSIRQFWGYVSMLQYCGTTYVG